MLDLAKEPPFKVRKSMKDTATTTDVTAQFKRKYNIIRTGNTEQNKAILKSRPFAGHGATCTLLRTLSTNQITILPYDIKHAALSELGDEQAYRAPPLSGEYHEAERNPYHHHQPDMGTTQNIFDSNQLSLKKF